MRKFKLNAVLSIAVIFIFVTSELAYDRMTEQRLRSVTPTLKYGFMEISQDMATLFPQFELRVISGFRSCDEQNQLFARGRTRPGKIVTFARCGQSTHNVGLGLDVFPFQGGKPVNAGNRFWSVFGRTVVNNGFEWGGNWRRFKDLPHFQIPRTVVSVAAAQRSFKQGGIGKMFYDAEAEIAKYRTKSKLPPLSSNQTIASKSVKKKMGKLCYCG